MRVVLCGGTGFIGQYVQKELATQKGIQFCVVGEHTPETEIDYGGEVLVILTQPGIFETYLLPQLSRYKQLKKIIFLSTLLLYPDSSLPQNEEVAPEPVTEYEKNKWHEEEMLKAVCQKNNIQLCIARIGNVYGDVQNRGIINRFLLFLLKGESVSITGDPKRKIKDFIFVEDVAHLLTFLIGFPQEKRVDIFNICTGTGHSLGEVVSVLERLTGKTISFLHLPPVLEKESNIGNNDKILSASGQRLRYPLEAGLRKTLGNYADFYQ